MGETKYIQVIALALCAVLVFAASTRIDGINNGREQLNMMGAASAVEQTPPEYAFAIQALGAFRGLIVDIAFIRAEKFKEQGRFYDAKQLAEWICNLQPYFPSVWEFAAWNLSWNISVTTFTPEERWNWVYNGIKLLRDKGIPYNPRAVNLYKQLAWTFNNKMGEITDDMHWAYKAYWVWRMHLLLGPPPTAPILRAEDLADQLTEDVGFDAFVEAARTAFEQNEEKRRKAAEKRGETYEVRQWEDVLAVDDAARFAHRDTFEADQQAVRSQIARIHAAPDTLEAVAAAQPAARDMIEQLRTLGIQLSDDPLDEDIYWQSGGLAHTFFRPVRRLLDETSLMTRLQAGTRQAGAPAERMEALDAILGVRAGDPAGDLLIAWLQKKVLREVYKLETEHMLNVVEEFGPVDWRSVDAHALYWVTRGIVAGGETINDFRNDKANTVRIMFFCLRNLFLRNRIVFEPNPDAVHLSYLNLGRDLNFIEPMHEAYLKYGPMFDPKGPAYGLQQGAGYTYRIGHINFLSEAIRLLYMSGREQEAAYFYRQLQELYPTNEEGALNPALAKTLHDYVMDLYLDKAETPGLRDIRITLDGLLFNAYSTLAAGDVGRYAQLVRRSRELHREYNRDKQTRLTQAKALPSFTDVQTDAFGVWLSQRANTAAETVHKARLWRAAPLYLRWATYDQLLPLFEVECASWGYDTAKAFPEPKGISEYRDRQPQREREIEEREVDTLPQTIDT
jgi:hypothetical protein